MVPGWVGYPLGIGVAETACGRTALPSCLGPLSPVSSGFTAKDAGTLMSQDAGNGL